MKFIYDLHQMMAANKVILIYEGDFTQETTKSILTMAERNLESSGEDSGIKKKIFNVMVEALQNIVKHGEESNGQEAGHHAAIFLIGHEKSQYSIMSGNPVKNENLASLKKALGQNKKATAAFESFSPSHKREYTEWISDAKRDETRQRRIETAVAQMAEGKSLNWKYQRKPD